MIKTVMLDSFLSYDRIELELDQFNVITGKSGAGKSNLIDAFYYMRQLRTSRSVNEIKQEVAGDIDYLCHTTSDNLPILEMVINYPRGPKPLRHYIEIDQDGNRFIIVDERIEYSEILEDHDKPFFFFGYENGRPMFNMLDNGKRGLKHDKVNRARSVISTHNNICNPELNFLASTYSKVAVLREWAFGRLAFQKRHRRSNGRIPITDLFAAITALKKHEALDAFLNDVRIFIPYINDIDAIVDDGGAQIYVKESGCDYRIPLNRLSDTAVRIIGLLLMLHHPKDFHTIVVDDFDLGLDRCSAQRLLDRFSEAECQVILVVHDDQIINDKAKVFRLRNTDGATTLDKIIDKPADLIEV